MELVPFWLYDPLFYLVAVAVDLKWLPPFGHGLTWIVPFQLLSYVFPPHNQVERHRPCMTSRPLCSSYESCLLVGWCKLHTGTARLFTKIPVICTTYIRMESVTGGICVLCVTLPYLLWDMCLCDVTNSTIFTACDLMDNLLECPAKGI